MSPAGAFAIAEGGPVGTFAPSVSAIVIRWGIRGTVAWSVDPSLRTMPQREPSTVPIGPVKVLCPDGWGLKPHDR